VAENTVKVNRAPVLTLWAAVVAERLGFDRDEALTLGRAVAGLNAHAKGQRLGIFQPAEKSTKQERKARRMEEDFFVELLGRAVPVRNTADGIRAVSKGKVDDPAGVARYLSSKFKDHLERVRAAMEKLAAAYEPAELAQRAYDLYTEFRPAVASGTRGWGQAGDLDVDKIESMAKQK